MIYVISDIHGCYKEFKLLLDKIHFSNSDDLYILGDIVDRGPEPIRLLQDLMLYSNIYPILGNHEYMALKVLSKFNTEITEEEINLLSEDDLKNYMYWTQDGGDVTAEQFTKLDEESRLDILDYLGECSLYGDIWVNEKRYLLVHAGIEHFSEDREMDTYRPEDLIFTKAHYENRYFKDENTFLLTGHTPTCTFRSDQKNLIYEKNGHIAIDCGCIYGGKLAAYCLNTGKSWYVDRQP